MKVAMLTSQCRPGGGTYTHLFYLCKYLSKIPDIDLHLITFEEDEAIKKFCSFHTLKKSKIKVIGRIFDVLSIKKEITEISPDIIHVQGQALWYLIMSPSFYKLKTKYPIISTIHGISKIEQKYRGIHPLIIKINSYIEGITLRKIPNIIVCSSWMKDMVRNISNKPDNIYIIPNGIDLEEIQKSGSKLININSPSIFFVGVLEKVKGMDTLLKAIPFIKKSIPDIYVYIAGSGPLENKLKSLAKKLDIEENIKFLGFVSEDEKYAYYKSVDVCVFPSRYEPFGIVLLEAMACGKPVITSNVGGIPFVVEDGKTGLLFESENVEDLAEKIVILLKDEKLRRKMGDAGLERVKEFTWNKITEQTVEVYREILERGRKQYEQ